MLLTYYEDKNYCCFNLDVFYILLWIPFYSKNVGINGAPFIVGRRDNE